MKFYFWQPWISLCRIYLRRTVRDQELRAGVWCKFIRQWRPLEDRPALTSRRTGAEAGRTTVRFGLREESWRDAALALLAMAALFAAMLALPAPPLKAAPGVPCPAATAAPCPRGAK